MRDFLWRFIFGKCKIKCGAAYAEDVLGIVKDHPTLSDKVKFEEGYYIVTVPESTVDIFTSLADAKGIEYTMERMHGIPALYRRYKHRPGIIIGIFLFLFITFYSGRIIWDFDITGNVNTGETEIIGALEAVGCSAGSLISDMDFAMIQNSCLIDSETLAWISVNMDGNLARVEVREKRVVPMDYTPVKGRFANIVAAEDGVVELCKVKNGKAVVAKGNVVRKGELLITGVIDIGESGVRYEYADGEVMATVYREIESFVPFVSTKQTPTGEKIEKNSVKIFGKVTNLFLKGSIDYELYGKIVENEKLSLPFGITLPIWLNKTVYSEMREETVTLSEADALKLAEEDASAKLGEMADSLQVLSVNKSSAVENDGVRVTLGVYGVTDISANYGFSVSGSAAEEKEDEQTNEENHNS